MVDFREERDSLGEVMVPTDALWGPQTQRAMNNFHVGSSVMPAAFIRALARIKAAAAHANRQCGALDDDIAEALEDAAAAVAEGNHAAQFPVPVFQTGSGTSTNMNMNEVLANLASGTSGQRVHPNDHANCSQSSNDVIPSCIQVMATVVLEDALRPALQELVNKIGERALELRDEVKTGRTHLMDALPLTFGQEMSAWESQLEDCQARLADLCPRLQAIPIGGSAVGTGVNVPEGFAASLVEHLNELTGISFHLAENRFSRMAGQDVALECSAALRSLAVVITKINNDLRWMSSGPLSGLGEIQLEALQPGSSIMPGKVNPVLPEAALMAAAAVIGNDTSIALAAQSGNFQLNVMMPLIAVKLLDSLELLKGACEATNRTISGFTVNRQAIRRSVASNPILVTALNSIIGYEAAAVIAKRSYAEQRPVLEVALEETDLPREKLVELLDPRRLTNPERVSQT